MKLIQRFKMLTLCLSVLLVTACSGHDVNAIYESVKSAYPNEEISIIPGEKWRYLVRKNNGDIIYVELMNNFDTEITQKYLAFKGN